MSSSTTLRIRLDGGDQTRAESLRRIEALERGEDIDDRHVLALEPTDLAQLTRTTTIELLRAINQHEPESMRDAAAIVDRDFKDVHRNLTELAALDVVELVQDGRAKRPTTRYDTFEVTVPLKSPPPQNGAERR